MDRSAAKKQPDEPTEVLKLERRGERQSAPCRLNLSLARNPPNTSTHEATKYQECSSGWMKRGMTETGRQPIHYLTYKSSQIKDKSENQHIW
ncbi:MAG TPA: hypothetical protein VF831_00645 [Anaerolineales bacterium]